jgi:excisionase family DNA binding protein
VTDPKNLPFLLTADEVAALLRTSRKAVYALAERGLLPGVTRLGRRLLVNRDDLLGWLERSRAPSPKETWR